MAHMVFDTRFKAEMEGLGVERQKMLLNEYRLQPWTREAQEFLVEQMNEFFFGEGGSLPKEYVAPSH